MTFLSSKEAGLALVERAARRELDVANQIGDIELIGQKIRALARAERARRQN
jgi:hypothetical protein